MQDSPRIFKQSIISDHNYKIDLKYNMNRYQFSKVQFHSTENSVVDEILELDKLGLKSVSLMYVGYADAPNDWIGQMKKVRTPTEEFVVEFK